MAQKPSTPKGTRDFLPAEVAKRNYIFDTIRRSFETYGFSPIETPSFELSSTLMGKYGDEGDRLIFKILNSGDFLSKNRSKVENFMLIQNWLRQELAILVQSFIENKNFVLKIREDVIDKRNVLSQIGEEDEDAQWKALDKVLEDGRYINTMSNKLRESIERLEEIHGEYNSKAVSLVKKVFDDRRIEIFYSLVHYINSLDVLGLFEFGELDNLYSKYKVFVDEMVEKYFSGLKDVVTTSGKDLAPLISEKALRYDLTVPFARFVVQHQNELAFPFKRYQIQPVWRADRPQKGRYQEFYQCDVDVVGSDSLLYEVDFVMLFEEVLSNLRIPDFTIKINNRKILSGIAEVCGEVENIITITVAIDKLDKIGVDGVIKELEGKGISDTAIKKIMPLFGIAGTTEQRLTQMRSYLESSEIGLKGIEELEYVLDHATTLGVNPEIVEFDVTLARGLNYYTGAIFEVKANGVNIGSICGGGRYDDLTGVFGMPGVSGVGISFGADRIYDVLEELNLFPSEVDNRLDVLFINFGEMEQAHCLRAVRELRAAGISSEVYPTDAKMQKQMKYANARGVKYVALLGANEIEEGFIKLKNMDSGEQVSVNVSGLIHLLNN